MNHARKHVLLEKGKYLTLHNFLLFRLQKHVTEYFQLFHLRSHIKNSCLVFHQAFQTPRNNKSTRPHFITFLVFGTPDETLALVFDTLLQNLFSTFGVVRNDSS